MLHPSQLKAAGIPVQDIKKVIDDGTRLVITDGDRIVGMVEHVRYHMSHNVIEVQIKTIS